MNESVVAREVEVEVGFNFFCTIVFADLVLIVDGRGGEQRGRAEQSVRQAREGP